MKILWLGYLTELKIYNFFLLTLLRLLVMVLVVAHDLQTSWPTCNISDLLPYETRTRSNSDCHTAVSTQTVISRDLSRNHCLKGFWPKQACELMGKRSEQSWNAATVPAWDCYHKTPIYIACNGVGLLHFEARKQVDHRECDTVIGANHNETIVTMVESKCGFWVKVKTAHKTSELVNNTIIEGIQPIAGRDQNDDLWQRKK